MKTVIITRPQHHIQSTRKVYETAGLQVFAAPCFALETNQQIQPEWLALPADTWVILSVPALEHALRLVPSWSPPPSARVIAVGPAVVQAWQARFSQPIESHPLMNSEGVIELLQSQPPRSINILTTGSGRSALKNYCLSAGISYTQINTYLQTPLSLNLDGLARLYAGAAANQPILTATSTGILKHCLSQLTAELSSFVLSAPLVVGAKRIAAFATGVGFNQVHVADEPSDDAMCQRVLALAQS